MLKKKMFAVATAAALCATAFAAQAKTTKSSAAQTSGTSSSETQATSKESKDTSRAMPFYGKIGTVDKANKTFTIEGKKSTRTFSTTDATKMEKSGGATATWEDLKAGEFVRGSAIKKSEGQYIARSIKLGQKERTASSAQPETKAKKQ